MLFRRALLFSSFLIVSVSFLAYFLHIQPRPSGISAYRKLVRESAERHSRRALERAPARQTREGVQKDIWAIDGTERLHFRLNSKYSELTLKQKKDKIEAVEELQQIRCWIQEKVDPTAQMQQVRTLTAQEGAYYFPSHRFSAHTVHLAFYNLPGFELPKEILPSPPLFSLLSNQALLTCRGECAPFLLTMEGNVRLFSPSLQGKESFALADAITYSPKEKKWILSSIAPKRVLFWQEGLSLSAPAVHIKSDPLTHQESIEGKGDVHFAFDLAEKNLIEQLLSKYL